MDSIIEGRPAGSNDWTRATLISGNHRASENAVRAAIAAGKMQVLDAVSYLASTRFTINKPVLAFMLRREEPRIQKLSARIAELVRERELRKLKWPERQELANLRAELSVWGLDAAVANAMERFHVPLRIDFRGRVNPLPFFSFTRQDHIRGLFLFTRSTVERPGNLDLANRIAWTNDNLELLRKFGIAVLRGDADPTQWDWLLHDMGDAYQFAAGCVELTQALDQRPGFETKLPLMFDATCSGLQHICAMTRAEEGRYVNLVPSNELSDLYSLVGTKVFRERPELKTAGCHRRTRISSPRRFTMPSKN